jgi:hypothetical protein
MHYQHKGTEVWSSDQSKQLQDAACVPARRLQVHFGGTLYFSLHGPPCNRHECINERLTSCHTAMVSFGQHCLECIEG